MTHIAHELHEEFPRDTNALHALKLESPHFRTLAERYTCVNHEIHMVESDVSPASDEAVETLKKERLQLKDQIAQLLRETA